MASTNKLYEWEGKDGFFMFNCDIGIYKDLNSSIDPTDGSVSCEYSACPTRNETIQQITNYAYNQTMWLSDYSVAWNKMMLAKCDENTLKPILP